MLQKQEFDQNMERLRHKRETLEAEKPDLDVLADYIREVTPIVDKLRALDERLDDLEQQKAVTDEAARALQEQNEK